MANKLNMVGQNFTSSQGEVVVVIAYENSHKVTVKFPDGFIAVRTLQWLKTGGFGRGNNAGVHNGKDKHYIRLIRVYERAFERCYTQNRRKANISYENCSINSEWTSYTDFVGWALLQHGSSNEGWQLDKDILVKGNKVYGPDFCCFVPLEINVAFTKSNAKRGEYPIGVRRAAKSERFTAQIGGTKNKVHLGSFDTPEQAFFAYKAAKEKQIKRLAFKYQGQLDPKVYKALITYEVEITD